MLTKILAYIIIGLIFIFGGIVTIQHFKIEKMEVNLIQKDNAISAYEELLKVIPFNRMVEERNDNAENEINATLHNSNGINDGSYKL